MNKAEKEIKSKLLLEDKNKCFYTEYNLYIEPKFEIIKYVEITKNQFPGCNSSGCWGIEDNGIMKQWFDLKMYSPL